MAYDRRTFTAGLAGLTFFATFPRAAGAQQVERSSLRLGVANKAHLYYLPLTLAERRGHFKDYGLTITTSDFEGGGQSLEALLAGSVDVVTGAYEHTLHTQAKGQDIRAVIELGRFPGVVLAVRKDRPFKSHADLKGMKIGVTAPGSSSHFFVLYLMAKAGLAPADATFVGVGGGPAAVDAMTAGDIDAISNLDPVITRLQQDGAIRIVTDSRFPRVNYEIFGGTNPAAVLYAKQEFIAANPNTMQALVNCLLQDVEVDRDGDDGRNRQHRSNRLLPRRSRNLRRSSESESARLLQDRHNHAPRNEQCAEYARDVRSRSEEREDRPAKDLRRSLHSARDCLVR